MPGSPSPSPFQTLAPSSPGIALLPAAAGMPSAVAGHGHDDFSVAADCDGPPFPYSLPHVVPLDPSRVPLAALSSSSSDPSSAPLPVVRPLAPSSLCYAIHAHQQLSVRPVAASHGGIEKWRREEMMRPEVGVTWWRGPLSRPEQAFPTISAATSHGSAAQLQFRISAATSHGSAAQLQFQLPPSFSLPPPIRGSTLLMVAQSWHRNSLEEILSNEPEDQIRTLPSPYLCLPLMSIMSIARDCSWRCLNHSPVRIDTCVVCLDGSCSVAAEDTCL